MNPRTGLVAGLGEQLEWPLLIETVLFVTSNIHIVPHCRVQSGRAFAASSPRVAIMRVAESVSVRFRGKEKDPSTSSGRPFGERGATIGKRVDGEFSHACSRVGVASLVVRRRGASGRAFPRRAWERDGLGPGWETPLGEREEITFFENVITDSHLLSFLGRRDRSNAVQGNEKRQRSDLNLDLGSPRGNSMCALARGRSSG